MSPGCAGLDTNLRRCATRRFKTCPSDDPVLKHSSLQPLANRADDTLVVDPALQETDEPFVTHRVDEAAEQAVKRPSGPR
jgi:molybdopterin-guanine dinucleotide biosynthesis protein A